MSDFEKHPIVAAHLSSMKPYDLGSNEGYFYRNLAVALHAELKLYEEKESLSTKKEDSGVYVLHVPVQYMVENAKDRDVKIYNHLSEALKKLHRGETEGFILPALTDDNGNRLFTLEYVGPK